MVVLKDYFRKIKSSPGTEKTEPEVTVAKESSETFNAFAGFGPIVRKTRNPKKAHKTSHLLKRPQRKIFLTVYHPHTPQSHLNSGNMTTTECRRFPSI